MAKRTVSSLATAKNGWIVSGSMHTPTTVTVVPRGTSRSSASITPGTPTASKATSGCRPSTRRHASSSGSRRGSTTSVAPSLEAMARRAGEGSAATTGATPAIDSAAITARPTGPHPATAAACPAPMPDTATAWMPTASGSVSDAARASTPPACPVAGRWCPGRARGPRRRTRAPSRCPARGRWAGAPARRYRPARAAAARSGRPWRGRGAGSARRTRRSRRPPSARAPARPQGAARAPRPPPDALPAGHRPASRLPTTLGTAGPRRPGGHRPPRPRASAHRCPGAHTPAARTRVQPARRPPPAQHDAVARRTSRPTMAAVGTPTGLHLRARVPGTLEAGVAELEGRPVVLVRSCSGRHRGALGSGDGTTLADAARLALQVRLPLVVVLSSSGSDVREGIPALHGWGRAAAAVAACSGVVPVLAAVTGPAISGPALLLGMADVTVMTPEAFAFVSGPEMVEGFTGIRTGLRQLGGAAVHATSTGLCALSAADAPGAIELLGAVLGYLPDSAEDEPPAVASADPPLRPVPELADVVPSSPTASYDVRQVARGICDDGELLELRAGWAPQLVTALGSVGGMPVGIVANQPRALAGTLDIGASQKGARFVRFCDAFNLPIVTLVDTPA